MGPLEKLDRLGQVMKDEKLKALRNVN